MFTVARSKSWWVCLIVLSARLVCVSGAEAGRWLQWLDDGRRQWPQFSSVPRLKQQHCLTSPPSHIQPTTTTTLKKTNQREAQSTGLFFDIPTHSDDIRLICSMWSQVLKFFVLYSTLFSQSNVIPGLNLLFKSPLTWFVILTALRTGPERCSLLGGFCNQITINVTLLSC